MAWLPLESNPDVINKVGNLWIMRSNSDKIVDFFVDSELFYEFPVSYKLDRHIKHDEMALMESLGVPSDWQIVDVYGLDPDLLATVPQPVLAVMLLFPVTENMERLKEKEEERVRKSGDSASKDVIFVKQLVSNACGTVALIHSIANNLESIKLQDGPLKKFIEEAKNLNAEEAGKLLESSDIAKVHDEIAEEGQTKAPDPEVSANFHYVAFVERNGILIELDGRKAFPIPHGSTTKENLLQDSANIIRQFMEQDPENIQFTMMALASSFA